MSDLHVILTGGTIDSVYNPITEKAEPADQSCIPEYIAKVIRSYGEITFEIICMLDSSDITDDIRSKILTAIIKTKAKQVVIAHGTNTMTKTQDFLSGKTQDKTVILTGSMIPLKQSAMSDGGFNLGYAIAQAQNLSAGVYICMHGKTFAVGKVRKNFKDARFEDLE